MSARQKNMTVSVQEGSGGTLTLCAPAVGRFRPHPRFARSQSQSLCGPGDELGTLELLGRRVALTCPSELPSGQVSLPKRGVRSVGWGEALASLTPSVHLGLEGAQGRGEAEVSEEGWSIEAPIDGTVYYAPSPDAPPFIKPGDLIEPGQVIALIEVMKFYYEIKHEGEGPVKALSQGVTHGAPIEAGAPLWRVTSP